MSLQQNIQTLYDNILSAKMWAALPNEVKLELIRDPENVDALRDDPKRIVKQANDNNQALTENQVKAILNTPPCPFGTASLKKFFLNKIPQGEKAFKELQEQAAAETERYLTKELTPMHSMDQIYDMLEHPEDSLGLEPHGKGPLPRYSSAQRKQRRAASAAVRKAHIRLADWTSNTLSVLPQLTRPYGALYLPEYTDPQIVHYDGTIKERNEEIGWLFNRDSERYRKEVNDLVVKLGPYFGDGSLAARAQAAEEQFAKRRGELVMDRLKDFQKIYNNLDTMTDPSLPAAELEKNFLRIDRACNMIPDIKAYLEDAENGFLSVSEQDKKTIAALQPNSVSSVLATAKAKLELIANPLFEYLDINTMTGYGMETIYPVYMGGKYNELEPGWKSNKINRKPEFKNYADSVRDNFSILLGDANTHAAQQKLAMAQMKRDILDRFGFEDQKVVHYKENYSDEKGPNAEALKHPDKPHAYRQGDRVVIIQQKTPTDTCSIMHPEAMYNQSLKGNNALHLRTLLATDPWYMINHGEFRELKKSLRKVDDLHQLKENFTPQDIEKATRRFERLQKACTAYMARKERDRQQRNDKKLNDREKERVEETRKILAYTKMKLKELQLVCDAKATLEKFRDKSLAEIKTITAEENRDPVMKAQILRMDQQARSENPGTWLQRLYNDRQLPQALRNRLDTNVSFLKSSFGGFDWLRGTVNDTNVKMVKAVAGATLAAQMVIQEQWERKAAGMDPAQKGPIETLFDDKDEVQKWIDQLGTAAMDAHLKENDAGIQKDPGTGLPVPVYLVNSFLSSFDPRENLERYRSPVQLRAAVYLLEQKYLNSIEPKFYRDTSEYPFKEFTKKSILAPAEQCFDPARNVSQHALDTLLSNTLVYEMIQEDRVEAGKKAAAKEAAARNGAPQNAAPEKGAASMVPLLVAPDQMDLLRTWVAKSAVYQNLRNSCLGADGQLSRDQVYDLMKNGISRKAVQSCRASYRESFAAWKKENLHAQHLREVEQIEQNNRKGLKIDDVHVPQEKAASEAPLPKAPHLP